MSKNEDNIKYSEEATIITMSTEDGEEMPCVPLTIFDVGDRSYMALLPIDGDDEDVILCRFYEENGALVLDNIDSDEEYDMVENAYFEWLDRQDHDL